MLFTIEPTCNCEMIPTTWLVLWKIPDAVLVRYAVTIPNQLCSLFVVCFHLFQPTTVSIGADIKGGEREIVVSRPLFSEIPRVPFESFALGFSCLFPVIDRIKPNRLRQFGHNVKNIRLVNTVSISFNTIARKTTERSQKKTGLCTFLLKKLINHSEATF